MHRAHPAASRLLVSVAALMAATLIACSGDKPADTKAPAPAVSTAAATAAPKATATTAAATSAATGAASASGATGAPAAVRVSNISNLKLESFSVKAGTTVQFNNLDGAEAPHALVGDKGEFDSKGPIAGGGFRVTFDKPGAIAYHCTIHTTMTGTITVQ